MFHEAAGKIHASFFVLEPGGLRQSYEDIVGHTYTVLPERQFLS